MSAPSSGARRMSARKRHRLYAVIGGLAMLGVAAALILTALTDNIVFFHSPTDIEENSVAAGQRIRLGGLVEAGSVAKQADGVTVQFTVTDMNRSIPVRFTGVLPDLFREGQGVVAEGSLDGKGSFIASEVLAKHDEQYMPPEVADALKRAGHWKDGVPGGGYAPGGKPGNASGGTGSGK